MGAVYDIVRSTPLQSLTFRAASSLGNPKVHALSVDVFLLLLHKEMHKYTLRDQTRYLLESTIVSHQLQRSRKQNAASASKSAKSRRLNEKS